MTSTLSVLVSAMVDFLSDVTSLKKKKKKSVGSVYRMAGYFSREKTFTNFTVLWLFAKIFSVKFWGVVPFGAAKARAICKSFLYENHIFHPKVVSLESFPLYGISHM